FHSAEVLSGFVNALFLLVISGSVFVNALARIHRPPHIHTDRLMAVSVAGLLVNMVGILALGHAHSHGHSHASYPSAVPARGHQHGGKHHAHGHSHGPEHESHKRHQGSHCHSHSGGDANLRGVYLHVLADTLGSVGVIFSSYLVSTYGWNIADPICSVFIACAIGYSAMPLLFDTLGLLTLRAPIGDQAASPQWIVNKVLTLDGVTSVYNPFVWSQTKDTTCVSLCVHVESNQSEQLILARVSCPVHLSCAQPTLFHFGSLLTNSLEWYRLNRDVLPLYAAFLAHSIFINCA
ncbi:Zinc transporter, partial [Paragonimus heterotremus]